MSKKIDLNKLVKNAGFAGHPDFVTIIKDALSMYDRGDDPNTILAVLKLRYSSNSIKMRDNRVPVEFFGEMGVDFGADVDHQISEAAKLPVAVRAAVMPDAHLGYALPIGGVIALENAISPHFVGFDIACRMSCSVLAISPDEFMGYRSKLFEDLKAVTSFGVGSDFDIINYREDPVMADPMWYENKTVAKYYPLAVKQLGSSGGGNHFADIMIGTVTAPSEKLPLAVGTRFVCLVTHSGSRGVGHKLATHYSKVAVDWVKHNARGIPKGYEWLPMDCDAGREYWDVMQLMGRYARANHHAIHREFCNRTGISVISFHENHHNFAWEENGLYVHRKGATPAALGDFGIIPGSMGTASYLVEGLGNPDSLNSASHGAGRVSSRTVAKKEFNEEEYSSHVESHDILVSGVEKDESYQAYKNIDRVIDVQERSGLLRVVARMLPKVVIMGGKSDDGD